MQHAAKTAAIQIKPGFTSIVLTILLKWIFCTFYWLLQVSNQQLVAGQEPFYFQYFLLSGKKNSCRRGWKNRLPPKWASGQNVRWRLLQEEHLFTEYLSFFKFQTKMTKSNKKNGKHLKKSWFHLKSVHFKNTVARSTVLSKLWSFSIIHQLTLFWLHLML